MSNDDTIMITGAKIRKAWKPITIKVIINARLCEADPKIPVILKRFIS
jgi:hypothetical protein